MQNYQGKFGSGGYGRYGQGNFIQSLPTAQIANFSDFSGGLDLRNAREDTPPNASPSALDVEVTSRDRLRPVPGTSLVETLAHPTPQLVLQASLDYTSELILFDPPFIGVKTGAETQWFDVGLPISTRRFAQVNFGGTLLFSNGKVGLYAKEAGKTTVELVDGAPAAHTLASFAGRVFAGASIIGGNREPLGISWTGASSNYEEWEAFSEEGVQTGAGFELLIDDMAQGNYIVALKTMGLDFLAVFLRNSIWIGRRTSLRTRPADFQPRVMGIGAVNEATCVVTRFGVVHLHDSGVYLFDGNSSTLISEQINSELIPLDRDQLALYSASYNPLTKHVYLFTPVCTWVYDLEHRRWYKRSLIARDASFFAAQIPAVTWAELTGTWGEQTKTWEEFKGRETELSSYLFLSSDNTRLDKEDPTSSENFGVAMQPYWDLPGLPGLVGHQLITTQAVIVEHSGPSGELDLHLTNGQGEFSFCRSLALKESTAEQTRYAACQFTGKGLQSRLYFRDGKVEVLGVQLQYLLRGPRIEVSPVRQLSLTHDGLVAEGYYTDFSNYTSGLPPAGWVKAAAEYGTWTVVDDVTATGGRTLRYTSASNSAFTGWQLLSFIDAGLMGEGEVLVRMKTAGMQVGIATRIQDASNDTFKATIASHSDLAGAFADSARLTNWIGQSSTANQVLGTFDRGGGWFWVALREFQGSIFAQWWLDGTARPAGWLLTVPIPAAVGYPGIAVHSSSAVNTSCYYDIFGLSTSPGVAAPMQPAAEGWLVLPGKFSFRITNVPPGYSVRAGGVTKVEQGGVISFLLDAAPTGIEFLRGDGSLDIAYAGAVENAHSYQAKLFYA